MVAETETTPQSNSVVQRGSVEIGKLIGDATSRGDVKNLRELATELAAALKREAQAEVDARNLAIATRVNPVKDQFTRQIERAEGLIDFIRENGGVLNYSYQLPAEGSDQGPLVTIGVGARASAAAARSSTPRTGGTGGGRGASYVVNGESMSLSGAFELVATAEEMAAAEEASHKPTRPDAAVWAIKSRVVNKAITEGRVTKTEAA